jgi:hypothetical protein
MKSSEEKEKRMREEHRWKPALFTRFCARKREAKKRTRDREEKTSEKKKHRA